MDRSLRATNLDNYNANGTIKTGKRQWVFSTQYCALNAELAELCPYYRIFNQLFVVYSQGNEIPC
jgi:hypothetical protein